MRVGDFLSLRNMSFKEVRRKYGEVYMGEGSIGRQPLKQE